MAAQDISGVLDLGDQQLEYLFVGPRPEASPTLVLLHEGLGCVGLWGDFPEQLSAATSMGVFAYSRAGYGQSSPVPLPRPLTYMHEEAQQTLPRVLDAIGVRTCMLVGHSDGASIAAIFLGSTRDNRVRAATLIAPHFFVEEKGLTEIAQAKIAYQTGTLREKLARWHKNVDNAFLGWNGAWLDPEFRKWDIREYLPRIAVPLQVIQGADDQYGTLAQVDMAKKDSGGPVETVVLEGARHAPHREAEDRTVAAISAFAIRVLAGDDRRAADIAAENSRHR
ncbi:MAG: alpha/beta fold hydrolase [Xanthobacteraceae bacterium]